LGESGCRDWYPVLPALAARYHVVAFDLPGFGRSTHANELYSPERYAQFIHQLLPSRLRAPFNLVGHSMGAALSLVYAARFPGEVARLLLIDTAGVLHRKAFVNFAVEAGLDNLLGLLGRLAKDVATEVSETAPTPMGPAMFPVSPDPSLILISETLRSALLGSPTRIAALALLLDNLAPAIDGVRSPAWILWGSDDAIASPRTSLILQTRLPSARLTILDGAGHDPMASRPAEVERFLLDALAAPAIAVGPKTASWVPVPTDHKGRCDRESGAHFSGDYAEIDIDRCDGVVLRDVRTSALRIRNSFVTVESTRVLGQAVALDVKGSRMVITASDFAGDVAVEVDGGELDLAGVDLRGHSAAVHVGGLSKLIFSVSRAESPIARRYLHDVYELDKGARM
jgi:pimeloyl-ACP methyl ester carboxylesterase